MSKRGHKTGTIEVVSKALQEVGPMTLAEMMDYTGFTKSACSHALRDLNKPIGVSRYELSASLPDDLRASLPTLEEIERGLSTDE